VVDAPRLDVNYEATFQDAPITERKFTTEERNAWLQDAPRTRPIRGMGFSIDLTHGERVRAGWKKWLTDRMPYGEFGTLTLAPVHGKNCRERKCDGIHRKGSVNCRLPGVQKTEKLISTFRKLCNTSFVVEEFGSAGGRRHFHYLSDGSTTERFEEQYCIREMGDRTHRKHDLGWNAVGFWKRFGGHVDNTFVHTYSRAVDYVLKDILKEETRVWF
jgi:hypothetical protein